MPAHGSHDQSVPSVRGLGSLTVMDQLHWWTLSIRNRIQCEPIICSDFHQIFISWFSAILAFCERNSPVTAGFPSQRPVTLGFDFFYNVCLNKRLSKQWRHPTAYPWGQGIGRLCWVEKCTKQTCIILPVDTAQLIIYTNWVYFVIFAHSLIAGLANASWFECLTHGQNERNASLVQVMAYHRLAPFNYQNQWWLSNWVSGMTRRKMSLWVSWFKLDGKCNHATGFCAVHNNPNVAKTHDRSMFKVRLLEVITDIFR